jgi:glycine betaine transporter
LYTVNLAVGVQQVGRVKYLIGNWLLIALLVLLYQLTPFEIEWVGMVVIGLYLVIYILLFKSRRELVKSFSGEKKVI